MIGYLELKLTGRDGEEVRVDGVVERLTVVDSADGNRKLVATVEDDMGRKGICVLEIRGTPPSPVPDLSRDFRHSYGAG